MWKLNRGAWVGRSITDVRIAPDGHELWIKVSEERTCPPPVPFRVPAPPVLDRPPPPPEYDFQGRAGLRDENGRWWEIGTPEADAIQLRQLAKEYPVFPALSHERRRLENPTGRPV
jgi:hypothetical protein